MADGPDARVELIEIFGVCDVTECGRETVLEGTEGVIGGLIVAPTLCKTPKDTMDTVMGARLETINHQPYHIFESSESYVEESLELFFDAKLPPNPPLMAPTTNRMARSSESQKVVGQKPRILVSSTRRGVRANSVALWLEGG